MGEYVAAAALGLLGAPFRLYGRSAVTGMDCVGLALLSLRGAGVIVPDPPPYRLRAGAAPMVPGWMCRAGLVASEGRSVGDLVLLRVGALQPHLVVELGDGIVHAHAGLGRVVRMAAMPDWPEISRWRVPA
jgi:murein DD-endopeptidase / murein LD-carboxypeptidase